jgi:hypothetical protein
VPGYSNHRGKEFSLLASLQKNILSRKRGMGGYAPAWYGSSLDSNPDILQKPQKGGICKGMARKKFPEK